MNYVDEMLQTIVQILANKMCLISNSYILDHARKNLGVVSDESSNKGKWILEIPRNKPLRSIESQNSRGASLIPELCCSIVGEENSSEPYSISKIEIKLKSNDYKLIFREEWDSKAVAEKLARLDPTERVMFRCHFEFGEITDDGEPLYHLNYGGVPSSDELCWIPNTIRHPRIPFIPMDLVLALDLLVANFYPQEYLKLQKEPDWRALVYTSEHVLLRPFIDKCAKRCNTSITRRRTTNDTTVFYSMWLISRSS